MLSIFFFDVYDCDLNTQSKTVYIDIRNRDYSKITLIPLSNIGLIEYFPIKADFYKAYSQIKEMKGEK